MKILFTGATGMIGKPLVRRLAGLGHEFTFLTRDPDGLKEIFDFPADVFAWHPEKGEPPAESLVGIDAVIHLAGESVATGRWSEEKKRSLRDSRIVGTRNLVNALRRAEAKPSRLIFGSAIGFYGDRGDEWLDENSTAGNDFLAKLVVDWEKEAAAADWGRNVRMRTGVVLGRTGGMLEPLLPLFRFGLGGPVGSGSQWIPWIHIDDVVSAFEFALDSTLEGPVNLVAPEPARNREFGEALGVVVSRPAFLKVPKPVVRLVFGQKAALVISGQFAHPGKLLPAGFKFKFPTLMQALTEIDSANELITEVWFPEPVETVFPFFSDAQNLEKITPAWLHFKILGVSSPAMHEGVLIDYQIKFRGVPIKWQTRIEEWSPNKKFVDLQLKGPYALWRHTHSFFPYRGGTLMQDRVRYRVPLGSVGRFFAGKMVGRDVSKIFAFRKKKIADVFKKVKDSD